MEFPKKSSLLSVLVLMAACFSTPEEDRQKKCEDILDPEPRKSALRACMMGLEWRESGKTPEETQGLCKEHYDLEQLSQDDPSGKGDGGIADAVESAGLLQACLKGSE